MSSKKLTLPNERSDLCPWLLGLLDGVPLFAGGFGHQSNSAIYKGGFQTHPVSPELQRNWTLQASAQTSRRDWRVKVSHVGRM